MTDSEDEARSPLEELEAKHRKEKKDLQAKIQAQKKNAKGGNKKQQKEANEATEAMEKEMKERHEREINELKLQNIDLKGTNLEAEPSNSRQINESDQAGGDEGPKFYREATKKSKAMLRREKKEEDSRKATAAAEEDRKNALVGKRAKEWEAINRQLNERGLSTVDIPSDGDCLFNAIADQLKRIGGVKNGQSGKDLRRTAADFMRTNSADFIHFIADAEVAHDTVDNAAFEHYCKRVEDDSTLWGGELEINALSRALKRAIQVLQPEGAPIEFGQEFSKDSPLVLTYHRHAFALGEHYNSTQKGA